MGLQGDRAWPEGGVGVSNGVLTSGALLGKTLKFFILIPSGSLVSVFSGLARPNHDISPVESITEKLGICNSVKA